MTREQQVERLKKILKEEMGKLMFELTVNKYSNTDWFNPTYVATAILDSIELDEDRIKEIISEINDDWENAEQELSYYKLLIKVLLKDKEVIKIKEG